MAKPSHRHKTGPRPDRRHRPPARHDDDAPARPDVKLRPDEVLARVLYRDGLIIIIDKPAGIPVHAGPKGGPNLEQFLDVLRFGLPRAPGLAHRLDRDTSGCLVLGRHPKALRKAGALFAGGQVEKTYWAVVDGAPPAAEGRVDLALKKETPRGGWKMMVARSGQQDGQEAVTDYRVLGASEGPDGPRTWLELKPRTGRTHQIRVHCAALGCPVTGDAIYGRKTPGDASLPLMLHARSIVLPLYPNRPPVTASAPPPPHMAPLLAACGWRADPGVMSG
ncbi:MAG: RNA pseudouridine synthase [Rhodospirillaceae bacterium]|nr:RNA pseudouridine synthase [Rhodospirillaceae bacterium]